MSKDCVCSVDALYGVIQAHHTIDQGPLFNKGNIEGCPLGSQVPYSRLMNKFESKQAVNIEKYTRDESVKGVVSRGVDLGRTAEALIPKKVFAKIDKKMGQFDTVYKKQYLPKFQQLEAKYTKLIEQAKGDKVKIKALEAKHSKELAPIRANVEKIYKEQVAKQFGGAKDLIQKVFDEAGDNPKKLEARLKSMGMTQQDAYYTHEYLKYLENGGPFFNFNKGAGSKVADWINQRISTITGKKVSFNPMTAMYNASELAQKGPAVFGYRHTANGIQDAMATAKKAGVTIFDEIPELKKAGVYHSDYSPLRPGGKFDPVTKSQNMLDNAAYFIGKRAGNPQKGLKEIAYRPKPWNDTFIYNDPNAKNLLNFMSFQFRHMQQYGGWARDVISNEGGRRAQSAKALAAYSLMAGVIFGDKAMIPAPIYYLVKGIDPEIDKHAKQLFPVSLEKGLVGAATGGNVDLGKYAQPFGGVAVGVGTDMVSNAHEAVTKTYPQAVKQLQKGRYDKAALLAINGVVKFSQLFKNGANAATQKAVDGVTKAYLDDADFEGYARSIGQKMLGKDSIPSKKKAAQPPADDLPDIAIP